MLIEKEKLEVGKWYLMKSIPSRIGYEAYNIVGLTEHTVTVEDVNHRRCEKILDLTLIKPIPDNWIIDKISALHDIIWDAESQICELTKMLSHAVPVCELPKDEILKQEKI